MILFTESLRQYGIFLATSTAFYLILLRNKLRFWENFIHEFTHLIVAILLMDKIRQFYVSETSGELVLHSSHKNILVSLSPYFFPVITLMTLLFLNNSTVIPPIIVACIYGLYFGKNINQIIRCKKEIMEFPVIGIPFIILMNFWFGLIILSWCAGKSDVLVHFLKL
ncbi:MAG TPA: hypothetical protein VKA38_08505 [Draconibacterium sp.]|nr:hypothetical protein [Draconibacterium sp.]